MIYGILLTLIALTQQSDSTNELIEQLRSGKIEIRQSALLRLKQLGKEAKAQFEKAARDTDLEVARSARFLLRRLEIIDKTSATLHLAIPDAVDRLASDDPHEWTTVFLQAESEDLDKRALELLSPLALRAASGSDERARVLGIIGQHELHHALAEVLGLLKDPHRCTRHNAAWAALKIDIQSSRGPVIELLKDSDWCVLVSVLQAIAQFRIVEATSEVKRLLSHEEAAVRSCAADTCGVLGTTEAGGELLKMFVDPEDGPKCSAIRALGKLRIRERISEIAEFLKDPKSSLRYAALEALSELDATQMVSAIEPMLKDSDQEMRVAAAICLCRLGSIAGVDAILDDSKNVFVLNLLSEPATYRRLACKTPEKPRAERVLDLIHRIAKTSGIRLIGRTELLEADEDKIAASGSAVSLLETIMRKGSYDAILGPDFIEILTKDEALRRWRDWSVKQKDSIQKKR